MITQTCKINMVPGGMPPIIHVSQYDAGSRDLTFELYSGATPWKAPSGATVTIDGTKPDGKAFSVAVAASGSTVTATLTQQMAAAAGRAECQLTVTKGENVLGSANFILDVERAALPEDADMSETDISSIETARTQTIAAMETAQAAAETAQGEAATATKKAQAAADSASAAASSKTAAATSATNAASSASAAAASAETAQTAAETAQGEAATATKKAQAAADSASAAASSKTAAATSATNAAGSASAAAASAETAQAAAETAQAAATTLDISSGSWTPTLSGMSSYNYRKGRYVKIGDVAIVSFSIWGTMAGSNTEQIKISGCPLIPAEGGYAGGGSLSGYYTDDGTIFTSWAASTDGSFYAYGQRTGSSNKWESSNIFQKTEGECGGGGTLMFKTSS